MSNREYLNIEITETIDNAIDNAIDIGIEKAIVEMNVKKYRKNKVAFCTLAACFALIFVFGATNPALAKKLPIIGGVFQIIEKSISFPGSYSKYATSVNQEISDNGVNVTLSDILCDGEGLYVTYIVKSEKPFKYTSWGDEPLNRKQLMTNETYNKVSFSDKELDNSGFAGLEGQFLDENTFMGMERYYLDSLDTEIPDSFDFQVELNRIGTSALKYGDKGQTINGTWAFKVPVKVDKAISKNIEVNYKTDKGVSLDLIKITPFSVVIYNTNPEHTHYGVKVFVDGNEELKSDKGRSYEDNKQVTYFGRIPNESKNLRIIIYKDILQIKDKKDSLQGTTETIYENLGSEILLDKVVAID